MTQPSFGLLFKKYRLKAEFSSLAEFGKVLGENGFLYDDSIFYHWQRNSRVPKNRNLLLKIVNILSVRGGFTTQKEINKFLESAGQGYITEKEMHEVIHGQTKNIKLHPKKIVKFIEIIGKSKLIPRTGWVMNDIRNPESVAEHSFRVSILAMVFANHLDADREKLIKMALLHNLGAITTGDLVWSRGTTIDIKKRTHKENVEKGGIDKVFKLINLSTEYKVLFDEMMARQSHESMIFRQLDKLELAFQALEYERSTKKNLEEFFISADTYITTPFLKNIMKQILKQRPLYQTKS